MLCGEKVILRAVERDDLPRLHAMERDVELTMLGNGDWQPAPLAAFEKQWAKRLEDDNKAQFVIEADGKVIGDCALQQRNRFHGTTHLGMGIYDREYIGKGYGREALELLLDWAFRIQNWRKVSLETFHTNERALRLYRSCGFVEEGRQRQQFYFNGTYVDLVIMGLLRTEWDARQKAKHV